jgi:hypothetical protein
VTRVATHLPASSGFACVMTRALDRDPDTNQSGLAHRIGWPEETFRGFMNGRSSPRFDALCAARKRMPSSMLIDLLQTLAGPLAVVTPAPDVDVSASATASALLAKAIESLHELTEFIEQVQQRGVDGRIDADDAAHLAVDAADVHRVLAQAVLMAHRCAARALRSEVRA